MLHEAVEGLAIKPDGIYVDGTFGRGGHSELILQQLSAKGKLIAIDKDITAVQVAKEKFGKDDRFSIYHGSFNELQRIITELGCCGEVSGILLDLGVSSPQLTDAERGFSFLHDGPLDMRMNTTTGLSAAEWLATVDVDDLATVLKDYGEERFAKRIARAIVVAREHEAIKTTKQLAEIIVRANPSKERFKHAATRSFQAIRIFINSELIELNEVLQQCLAVLQPLGRLVVISFHSLEDRIVKRFIRKHVRGLDLPHGMPVREVELHSQLRAIGKAMMPSEEEIKLNPSARSAVLRIAERLN